MTSNDSKNYSKNCSNCGKIGHILRDCEEPVTSVGIVCFKLNKTIYKTFLQNLSGISYYDLSHMILNNIHLFNTYNDMIEFMLVKRRHSLNYIEFIRGKYDPYDIERIENMFSLMSMNEVEMIKTKEFNYLWNNLWMKNAHKKKYMAELNESKEKFTIVKSYDMNNFISEYNDTEWEIPKGRKNSSEKNIDCAVREFREETSITYDDYIVISCLDPIHDNFTGTNGKQYRHIFYTSLFNDNIEGDINHRNNEIELVRWCKWSELNDIIRPYNNNKINIFTSVLIFIMNICESHNDISFVKN
jgi:8-oxo-dGTP pyrophosphatase MutT (NUDIX family)